MLARAAFQATAGTTQLTRNTLINIEKLTCQFARLVRPGYALDFGTRIRHTPNEAGRKSLKQLQCELLR